MPISTLSAAAVLAGALLTAAACGPGDTGEVPRLPVLQPAQLTSSAVDSAPPGSATALAAARGVVRRYYAALDGLRRRMRVAPLARLMTADCPCRAQLRAVRSAMSRGDRYTDRVRVLRLVAHLDRPDLVDVVVTLDVTRAGLVGPEGRRRQPVTAAHNLHRELLLRSTGGTWQIAQVIAV
jgi:hypothetical protein